ncbi:MAG: hypothetical protein KDF59_13015 [Nitrosomonas sp.]|nr:hypothetical protein [Nitrosomonas sp.]
MNRKQASSPMELAKSGKIEAALNEIILQSDTDQTCHYSRTPNSMDKPFSQQNGGSLNKASLLPA